MFFISKHKKTESKAVKVQGIYSVTHDEGGEWAIRNGSK